MTADIAIVTVNWNGWRHTLDCLASLRRTQGVTWRLFIVDNASSDDSLKHLSGLGDDVTLICSPRNSGWTGGNNLGVEQALRDGYEHIFLLNNDALVEPDTLTALLRAESSGQGRGAILGAELRTVDDQPSDAMLTRIEAATGVPKWYPLDDQAEAPADGLVVTASVCGAALFAHRSVFEEVGAFDDDFYLYFDETEWCFRGVRGGRTCWVATGAVVRHVGFSSTGGEGSPLFHYFMVRNELLFAERYSTTEQRLRQALYTYRHLRFSASTKGWRLWPLAYLFSRDPQLRAIGRGAADYLLRRFGECPPMIRRLNDEWRSAKA